MAGGGGEGGSRGGSSLEFTPTWVAALVCAVIVTISLAVEKIFHLLSKRLKTMNRQFLYKALEKLKEELLLMGFLSLLLARLQDEIVRVCIPPSWALKGLPCNLSSDTNVGTTTRYSTGRHLLAEDVAQSYCQQKGKVPLISYHALHDLHILIFVLAVTHAVVCAFTMLFGAMKISRWKAWEKSIIDEIHCAETGDENDAKAVEIKKDDFIKSRYLGDQARKRIWLQSFAKHLYCPVSESDYAAMRTGFVMTHCGGNLKFSFYEYMMRVFEADFAKVISISGFVWVIVVISLLLNLAGWHMYFWIAFLPFILLLVLGTKLEQVITVLATEIARRQPRTSEETEIQLSDRHFWFQRPKIALSLINVILSCNSFAIALFFWIYSRFGAQPCGMKRNIFTIPRLVIVVIVQVLLSYNTLPLYAIVTQMGSSCQTDAMENPDNGSIDDNEANRRGGSRSSLNTVQVAKIL